MMTQASKQPRSPLLEKSDLFLIIPSSTMLIMGVLLAIINIFLSPDKSHFGHDNIIACVIAGLLSGIQLFFTLQYTGKTEHSSFTNSIFKSILPICSHCKKVRPSEAKTDRTESWQTLDCYIAEHTATEFSHGFCPDCLQRFYPELFPEIKANPLAVPANILL